MFLAERRRETRPKIERNPTSEPEHLTEYNILDLLGLLENLGPKEQKVFNRIYEVYYGEKKIFFLTEEAKKRMAETFNVSSEEISNRRVLEVRDKILHNVCFFNPLRGSRPIQKIRGDQVEILKQNNPQETCRLCPERKSDQPYDTFGIIETDESIIYANVAPYVPNHSLIIPKNAHHPQDLSEDIFVDMVSNAAQKWFYAANLNDPRATYPLMGINMFPRAGASQYHPHVQILLTERPLFYLEDMREHTAFHQYINGYPYLDELAFALKDLGLVFDMGSAHVIFSLTPRKEKEIIVYSQEGNGLPNENFAKAIFDVIKFYEYLGETSYNLAIYMPPIRNDLKSNLWYNFFPFARLIARGDEGQKTNDYAVMETMYNASVVSADPFKLARSFYEYQSKKTTA